MQKAKFFTAKVACGVDKSKLLDAYKLSRPDIDEIFSRGHQRDQRHHQFAPYGGGGYNHGGGGGGGRYNDNRAPIQHNPNSNYVQWDGERKKSDQQQSGWR